MRYETGNPKDKQESCWPISILIKRKASFKSKIIIDDKYNKQRMAISRLYANKPGKIVKVNLAWFNEYLRKEQMPPTLKAISYYFDDVHLNCAKPVIMATFVKRYMWKKIYMKKYE